MDDLHFGVHQDMMYARNVPAVEGAQWTGVVTQIAIDMLESGKVDAVICVQNDQDDRFKPKPVSWHMSDIPILPAHVRLSAISLYHMHILVGDRCATMCANWRTPKASVARPVLMSGQFVGA